MRILSVGEVVWDVFEDSTRLGGAPLNFAVNVSRLGHDVIFVSGVGEDDRGDETLERIRSAGLSTEYIQRLKDYPTGYVEVNTSRGSDHSFVIHRPAAYDFPALTPKQNAVLASMKPDWLYFGTLQQTSDTARRLIKTLIQSLPDTRRFYDMNLREGEYTMELVRDLLDVTTLLKLNEDEANCCADFFAHAPGAVEDLCGWLVGEFGLEGVCITRGSEGCTVHYDGQYIESPGFTVDVVDAVGAGDAFAAAFLHGKNEGWSLSKTCEFANQLGAQVASKPGALPEWSLEELQE